MTASRAWWKWALVYATLAIAGSIFLVHHAIPEGGDFHYFQRGARRLFGADGLHVYTRMGALIIGPLALAVDRLVLALGGADVLPAIGLALGIGVVALVHRLSGARPAVVLIGGLCFLWPWSDMIRFGHLEDGIVYAFVAASAWAIVRRRPVLLGVFLGCAAASKQWGFIFLPLALAVPTERDQTVALGTGFGIAAVSWLPFVLADGGTLGGLTGVSSAQPGSLPGVLGIVRYGALMPDWWRLAEVGALFIVCVVVVTRLDWYAAPFIVMAMRCTLDPYTWSYYAAGVLFGAFLLDAMQRRRFPIWSVVGLVYVSEVLNHLEPGMRAIVRVVVLVGVIVGVVVTSRRPNVVGAVASAEHQG